MATYIGKTNEQHMNGQQYAIQSQDMTGRIYKPGKHMVNDKMEWIDKEGTKDTRIMVFGATFYHVYNTGEEVLADWGFDEHMVKFQSNRVKDAASRLTIV